MSTKRDRDCAEQAVGQPMRPGQQAEQHEHHDLRQPGDGVEENHDGVVCARLPVADHKSGKIDGEKTRRMHALAKAKTTSALTATNGACRPCARYEPVEHQGMTCPPARPMTQPSTASRSESRRSVRPTLIADHSISTSSKARNTAKGSLVPDSTSSTARTRGRRRRPRALMRKKTAAASVDATTAPISRAGSSRCRARISRPAR